MDKPIIPPVVKVLFVKPFLKLWLAQVLSQVAANMLNFVLLLHIASLTKSNTATSFFIIAISIPAVIFGSLAGVYVDLWFKKQVLFVCNLLRFLILFIYIFTSESLFLIFVLAILVSIITQFFVPAEAPLIPDFVPKNLLLAANSLFTLTFYISIVFGFMIAGPAIALFGVNFVFIFIGVLFLAATLLVSKLPGPDSWRELYKSLKINFPVKLSIQNKLKSHFLADLKEGFSYILRHKNIQEAIFLLTASQVLIATISAIAPGYAATVLRINVTDASLVIVAPAVIGMIGGSIAMGFLGGRINKQKIIEISIVFAGIFLTALSFLSRGKFRNEINFDYLIRIDILSLAVFFLFLLGVMNSLITVTASTVLQEETKEQVRSRVYGFMTSGGGLASILPVLLAGVFADMFGVVKVMFGIGLSIIIFGVLRIAYRSRLN